MAIWRLNPNIETSGKEGKAKERNAWKTKSVRKRNELPGTKRHCFKRAFNDTLDFLPGESAGSLN